MILHDISVHLFMPAGIDSPGFVEEEREKPKVTRKIEESDEQISPEKCAEHLFAGESSLGLLFPLVFLPLL
jgi:3-dehydrosphinganine reductase